MATVQCPCGKRWVLAFMQMFSDLQNTTQTLCQTSWWRPCSSTRCSCGAFWCQVEALSSFLRSSGWSWAVFVMWHPSLPLVPQSAKVIWWTVGVNWRSVRIQGFPTEYYTVARWSVLFTLTVVSMLRLINVGRWYVFFFRHNRSVSQKD